MAKIGRNEKCPCGSGKKYKHCCLGNAHPPTVAYTSEDRVEALTALVTFSARRLREEREEAGHHVWGEQADRADEPSGPLRQASEDLIDAWFWFDRPLDVGGGVLPIDLLLRHGPALGIGARAWLERMRASSMRLYEVVDAFPGVSIQLRDVVDGGDLTVSERSLSRQVKRSDALAARVVSAGASGRPELDLSVISVPMLILDHVRAVLEEERADFRRDLPGEPDLLFWKEEAPILFHQLWMGSILDPVLPRLANTDGEPLVLTRVRFTVADRDRIARALLSLPGVEAGDDGEWSWTTTDRADPISLGVFRLHDGELHLECNSVARGERGKALVEGAAGDAVRFIAASHEDPTEMLRERLRRGDGDDLAHSEPPASIPADVLEELTLNHLARHYRDWVDHPVPALGGATPREAARRPALLQEVMSLVRGIEGQYQAALRAGEPAYDPSWMWEDLGLSVPMPPGPLPAAHDRLDGAYPGLGVLSRQVAHRLREEPGFDDRSTRCRREDLDRDVGVARFLREQDAPRELLPCLVDFEAHRRKTFTVDRSLAWMLLQTELDVAADDVRLPFVSFALVFTDRAVLSLAERLVAATRRDSPVAGSFCRVLTVFVSGSSDNLELRIVVDPLGTDPPVVIEHVVALGSGRVRGVDPSATPQPLPGLVHAVVSAVLYATSAAAPRDLPPSAGVPQRHAGARPERPVDRSDEVFHLPGTIDISRLRELQSLERLPSGRPLLHRFLVRGHWRRPGKSYKDQRLRWIEPYWKGPELASVVEKAYRLVP